jgi:hypothetical protein
MAWSNFTIGDLPWCKMARQRPSWSTNLAAAINTGPGSVRLREGGLACWSAACSSYRVTLSDREVAVRFEPKADRNHMTVALASMVAKYVRERSMDAFNAYWCREIPGIEPTAGYPQDAKRFLALIESARERLGIPMELLWRKK